MSPIFINGSPPVWTVSGKTVSGEAFNVTLSGTLTVPFIDVQKIVSVDKISVTPGVILWITPEFKVESSRMPNWWRRFWTWILLGWKWERRI